MQSFEKEEGKLLEIIKTYDALNYGNEIKVSVSSMSLY